MENKQQINHLKLYARAKINPSLDVLGKLDDGYHNLEMTMQTINICDIINISRDKISSDISLYTNLVWLPTDSRNLVYKVAEYLKETYNIKDGIRISLTKKIPVCAGLAGGSTDCAAALIGIRNMFRLSISNDELLKIGKQFGADVPFCIMRGTALAKGIGEKLTKLKPFPQCYILVAKPNVNVSTKVVFNNLDLNNIKNRPDTEKIIYFLEKQDLENISKNLCNVLEDVTIKSYPIIQKIKNDMLDNGALGSLMSGSGSAVFGIFKTKKQAIMAAKSLNRNLKIKETFVTNIFNNY